MASERRGWRRVRLVLAINAIGFLVLFGVAELVVRVRSEGSLGAAWSSFFGETVHIADEGDTDWLELHPVLGYRLNTAQAPVSSLGIRHAELVPSDDLRVIVLGDSVSWEDEGWVAMLCRGLADRVDDRV